MTDQELKRWAAYQIAAGGPRGWYTVDANTGHMIVSVRGLDGGEIEVELGVEDFDGILLAPIGRWYP